MGVGVLVDAMCAVAIEETSGESVRGMVGRDAE